MGATDELLGSGGIRRVPVDENEARAMLGTAQRHLEAASQIIDVDRSGAYILAYDAARKAITAHMAASGLAPASRPGAHKAVGDYAMTLGKDHTFRSFDRRNRNRSECGTRKFSRSEVERDLDKAQATVATVAAMLS